MKPITLTLLLLALISTACSSSGLHEARADEADAIDESEVPFSEAILGRWEMTTFHNGVDVDATSEGDAIDISKALGAITFSDDGTFTVEGYDEDDYYGGEPLHSLFYTVDAYINPDTLELVYSVEHESVLCLRYLGKTQVTKQFEVKDYALTLVRAEDNTLVLSYPGYPAYVLTR